MARHDALAIDPQAQRDFALLMAVLEHDSFDGLQFDGGSPREVFEGWQARLKANGQSRPLSEKQRTWLEGVARRLEVDLGAQNLFSSGALKVKPSEVASLKVFLGSLDRPKLPPHKRCVAKAGCPLVRGHQGDCI